MLRVVLDTNTLIRFFTNDVPERASKVKELLESGTKLYIPQVVFPELEYVLCGHYRIEKERLLEIFFFLLAQKNIAIDQVIRQAVEIYKDSELDMADCIIAASSLKGRLASFDKELIRVKQVKAYW